MARKGSKGGGRLSRSETVTVRLDPKLNYLCELASRAQRRTKSSFIEWAIEHSLKSVPVLGSGNHSFDGTDSTIAELASQLWDTDEPDRLALLAFHAPSLMNHEEQVIWKLVCENGYFWKGHFSEAGNRKWIWRAEFEKLIQDRLREYWKVLVDIANGHADPHELPTWEKYKSGTDLSEEIPF